MKFLLILLLVSIFMICTVRGDDTNNQAADLARIKSDYADVLALEGTAKQEILAVARLLRAKPDMAIDHTAGAGEYCLKSGPGTMVHFASDPSKTAEDIVYEFDASDLIKAGLDPEQLLKLPKLGGMQPDRWYFLPLGIVDPHHQHVMSAPTIAIAMNVR